MRKGLYRGVASFQDFRNYWRRQPEREKVINGEKVEDIVAYKSKMKAARRHLLIKMMRADKNDECTDS